MRSRRNVISLLLLAGPISVHASVAEVPGRCGTPFALTAEHATLPITVLDDFILLDAEVNGTRGKMMFDTGTPGALVLNDDLLKDLGSGKVTGKARVGSGQTYTVTIRNCVSSVSIPGFLSSYDVPLVESNNLRFMQEDITPDFLGFVGYQAFAGYTFEIDYGRRRLTFEKGFAGVRPSLLHNEKIISTLPFTTRSRQNSPLIPVRLGGQVFIATLDTGQSGSLEMSDSLQKSLINDGSLTTLPGKDEDGTPVYRVNDLELGSGVHISLPAMTIHRSPSPSDKGIGITETAVIHLGFQMLSQFKTVWDWPNHTIYLLRS